MPKDSSSGKRKPRYTSWMITSWNDARPELSPGITYIKGVREKAPTTGKLHWQTMLCSEQLTMKQIIESYPNCHVEPRKGTFLQGKTYCTLGKGLIPPDTTGIEGTCYELGKPPRPGARTDIEEMASAFLQHGWDGVSDTAIVKYHKGLERLKQIRHKKKCIEKVVRWYWGESGAGKTRAAYGEAGDDCYVVPARGGWFDNYHGEKHILIDDYDAESFPIRELLRILDRYPEQVPVKGGFVHLEATHIWITSRFHPNTYFPPSRWPEIFRRLSDISEFLV